MHPSLLVIVDLSRLFTSGNAEQCIFNSPFRGSFLPCFLDDPCGDRGVIHVISLCLCDCRYSMVMYTGTNYYYYYLFTVQKPPYGVYSTTD